MSRVSALHAISGLKLQASAFTRDAEETAVAQDFGSGTARVCLNAGFKTFAVIPSAPAMSVGKSSPLCDILGVRTRLLIDPPNRCPAVQL